jgi:hypothetical protein
MEQEETAVARQWRGKHVFAATNKHATIEEPSEAVSSPHCVIFFVLLFFTLLDTTIVFFSSLSSSIRMKGQLSQSYETTGKIVICFSV